MANQVKVAWAGAEVLTTGDADQVRVAYQGAEALTTGTVDQTRAVWFGADVLTTGTLDQTRAVWFGAEVLTTRGVNEARIAWQGVEVLTAGSFAADVAVDLAPNVAKVAAIGAATTTRLTLRTPWLVVWSSGAPLVLSDSATEEGRRVTQFPYLYKMTPGQTTLLVTADANTTTVLEARWRDGVGRARGLRRRRGPL